MNDKNLYKQIMVKLCQCVLQSRINMGPDQIKIFNQFIHQFQKTKEKANKGNLHQLLSKLVNRQQKQTGQKIGSETNFFHAIITFQFFFKDEHVCMQKWILALKPNRQFDEQNDEIFLFTASLFEEFLFFLTSLPLFKQYIKDRKMQQQYKIHYNLYTDSGQIDRELEQQDNLHFPLAYSKERGCEEFKVSISCFSMKSIYELHLAKNRKYRNNGYGKKQKKNFIKLRNSAEQVQQRKQFDEEFVDLHQEMDRKHSLYQIYDHDLECTLLSNLESSFSFSPKGSVKEIKFFPKELGIEEEEFQILKISADDEFLQDNKKLFKDLSESEKKHKSISI